MLAFDVDDKFETLKMLGAGDFEHLDGSLIDHLKGTQRLLALWSASKVLQDAGLYHAAYGTQGFDEHLVATDQRNNIAEIVGGEAEELVYQYCACDRGYFWPQIGTEPQPLFKNRFTGKTYQLSQAMLHDFCELTVANELEIAEKNDSFIVEYGESLKNSFKQMRPYLSDKAYAHVGIVLKGD